MDFTLHPFLWVNWLCHSVLFIITLNYFHFDLFFAFTEPTGVKMVNNLSADFEMLYSLGKQFPIFLFYGFHKIDVDFRLFPIHAPSDSTKGIAQNLLNNRGISLDLYLDTSRKLKLYLCCFLLVWMFWELNAVQNLCVVGRNVRNSALINRYLDSLAKCKVLDVLPFFWHLLKSWVLLLL